MRHISFSLFFLLLVSCRHDTMDIQKEYSSERDACQNFSEAKIESYLQFTAERGEKMTPQVRNEKLVTFFNDCMAGKNWEIAPKPVAAAAPGNEYHLENRGVGIGVAPGYALEKVPNAASAATASTDVPAYAYQGSAAGGYRQPGIAQDLVVPPSFPLPQNGVKPPQGTPPETMLAPSAYVPARRAVPAAPVAEGAKPAVKSAAVANASPPTAAAIVSPAAPVPQQMPVIVMPPPTTTVVMSPPAASAPVTPQAALPPSLPPAAQPAPSPPAASGKLSAEQKRRLRDVLRSE